MTTSRIPEPADPFEEEGLPNTDSVLPQKIITGDAQEGMAAPADRQLYGDGYGVTAAEQARGETIDAYLAAEEPDVLAALNDPADTYSDADSVADPFPTDSEERVGRLVDIDEGARTDAEPDLIGSDVGTDTGGFSAEERAMHLEPEPVDGSALEDRTS
ncbi:MAG: DUF5709 domain-containing protein [Frankiaceae bacterium]|jgi:hypothetical protein